MSELEKGDDAPEVMTSAAAARYLGVSSATIKRWADADLLPCIRTAGHHRRFRKVELDRFRETQGVADQRPATATDELLELVLTDNPIALEARMLALRAELGSWWAAAEAMGPVLELLGRKWEAGLIGIVDEHLASERLARALARVAERLRPPPDAPKALLTTSEGDDHTLGLSLLEVVLQEAGCAALWSGRRTPFAALPSALHNNSVRLVAVSASRCLVNAEQLQLQARRLVEICEPRGVRLLLGGQGDWPENLPGSTRIRDFRTLRSYLVREWLGS